MNLSFTTGHQQQQQSLLPQVTPTSASSSGSSPTSNSVASGPSTSRSRSRSRGSIFSRFWGDKRIGSHNSSPQSQPQHHQNTENDHPNHSCLEDPLIDSGNDDDDGDCLQESALLPPAQAETPNRGDVLMSTIVSNGSSTPSQQQLRRRRPSSPRIPMRRSSSSQNNSYAREMIRRAGNYLAYATLLTMLIVIPIVAYHALKLRKVDSAAIRSAGVMAWGTVILSSRLVYLHLSHWYMPQVQKYVVRILWMVPLYAVQSWLSLWFHQKRVFIDAIRDLYEAYVIASFVYYLMELLGGQEALTQLLRYKAVAMSSSTTTPDASSTPPLLPSPYASEDTDNNIIDNSNGDNNQAAALDDDNIGNVDHPSPLGQHAFPLSLILQPWMLGREFMLQCKHGVLQYVVVKVFITIFTVLCESIGIYGEGKFEWYYAYPYICFFQNISVMYALYCLFMLFSAISEELRHPVDWRPLGKFLCVKGVVFFTWWQGVVIFYLKAHGLFDHVGTRWTSEDVANGLIDYCVCIEMVGFAIAHSYTFSYKEYLPENFPAEYRRIDTGDHTNNTAPERERPHNHQSDNPEQDNNTSQPRPGIPSMTSTTRSTTNTTSTSTKTYRPPAILDQPMAFKKALWDSTVPKETIQDIQTLRSGVEDAVYQAGRPRLLSLPRLNRGRNAGNNQQQQGDEASALSPPRLLESTSLVLFPSSSSSSSTSLNADDQGTGQREAADALLPPPTLRESTSLILFPTSSSSAAALSSESPMLTTEAPAAVPPPQLATTLAAEISAPAAAAALSTTGMTAASASTVAGTEGAASAAAAEEEDSKTP